jgi:hypothetical protein
VVILKNHLHGGKHMTAREMLKYIQENKNDELKNAFIIIDAEIDEAEQLGTGLMNTTISTKYIALNFEKVVNTFYGKRKKGIVIECSDGLLQLTFKKLKMRYKIQPTIIKKLVSKLN